MSPRAMPRNADATSISTLTSSRCPLPVLEDVLLFFGNGVLGLEEVVVHVSIRNGIIKRKNAEAIVHLTAFSIT
jgi:hypothetical protein